MDVYSKAELIAFQDSDTFICYSEAKQLQHAIERQAAQIESLRQQLAAAIAACKLKDEALQNCEGMLDELRDYPITHDAIIEALAIQPDDSALKVWLGEPRSYLYKFNSEFGDGTFWSHRPTHNGADALESLPLYASKGEE